jgi:hypothetical protein
MSPVYIEHLAYAHSPLVIISSNSFCAPGHFIKIAEGGIEIADTNEPLEQDVAGRA